MAAALTTALLVSAFVLAALRWRPHPLLDWRRVGFAAMAAGALAGLLEWPAWLALGAFALLVGWLGSRPASGVAFVAVFAAGLVLGFGLWPGFAELTLAEVGPREAGAEGYAARLRLDKYGAGLILLGALAAGADRRRLASLGLAAVALPVLAGVVFALGLLSGVVAWSPGGLEALPLFLPVQVLVVGSETAFFQLLLQDRLHRHWPGRPVGVVLATGVVFGLVHLGGGLPWAALAAAAGVGYAWVYHRSRDPLAPMALHWGLNTLHWLLLTDPGPATAA